MWTVLLIVCPLGMPVNPVHCRLFNLPNEAFMIEEACYRRAGKIIAKLDPMLRPEGLELWRSERWKCKREPGSAA